MTALVTVSAKTYVQTAEGKEARSATHDRVIFRSTKAPRRPPGRLRQAILRMAATLLTVVVCVPACALCSGRAQLSGFEQNAFISAAYSSQSTIAVQVLMEPRCDRRVMAALRRLGAEVRFADDQVGYVLTRVPKQKVLAVLDVPGIAYAFATTGRHAASTEDAGFVPPALRKAAKVPAIQIPVPRVAMTLPADGPYFAAQEAGLTTLWQQHPEADGRGVRVAVVDQGMDLLHPALRVAKDTRGNPVPKVADVVVSTDPNEDPNWVQFGGLLRTRHGAFEAAGQTWRAPEEGAYRLGIFTRNIALGPDLGAGYASFKSVTLSVGVLSDEQTNRVWVDTDGCGDFARHRALEDYSRTHQIDFFGAKLGEDDNRIPFGIRVDHARHAAYLSIADGYHGMLVAGPLAANRQTGGLFDGAAPNAQLVDVRQGSSLESSNVALLRSFARPDIEVINRSGLMGLAKDDGEFDFQLHLLERAFKAYDKPILGISVAPGALTVFDYQSPEMLRRNRQIRPPYAEAMTSGVLFPSGEGVINTLVAPSASLIPQARYMSWTALGADGRTRGGHSDALLQPMAPEGYGIASNPSPTIPVVSGVLADLISEARSEHIRYNAYRLIQAVLTGAKLVPAFPASEQGFGLVDAANAWNQLYKMSRADDPNSPQLTSFTLQRSREDRLEEVHGFQADLPSSGDTLSGELWTTRKGGYSGGRSYTLSLRGNDGTYRLLDREVIFERDHAAAVRFEAKVTPGLHVAFLQLRDEIADVVMQEVPLAVRAPDRPMTVAPGTEQYQSRIPPMRVAMRWVRLGEEAQAARWVMRIPYEGPGVMFASRFMPGFHYGIEGNRFVVGERPAGDPVDAAHHVGPMQEFESLVLNSKPGTQVIVWDNYGHPEYATPYDDPAPDVAITGTLLVTKYAVDVSRENANVRLTNRLADIDGKVELYDATIKDSRLTTTDEHGLASLERTLPEHLSQWRVSISAQTLKPSRIDVFLLHCSSDKDCSVAVQQPIRASSTLVTVDDPNAGKWQIVLRARDPTGGPDAYLIREALLTPSVTSIEMNNARHASGATWSVTLPPRTHDAQYLAFRIAGTPGVESEKGGVRIAVTPMAQDLR